MDRDVHSFDLKEEDQGLDDFFLEVCYPLLLLDFEWFPADYLHRDVHSGDLKEEDQGLQCRAYMKVIIWGGLD